MLTIVSKPIEFFHPDPSNPRKEFDEGELDALGESLKKKQLVPGIALEDGTIVDMHRRWMAAKRKGIKFLDVYLLPVGTPKSEIKEAQLITALHRVGLKPYEVYCGCQDWLKSHPDATAKQLAKAIDRSEASVSMTLSLSRCSNRVQEAAASGQIGPKDWYAISQAPAEAQEDLLMATLRGAKAETLKRMRKPVNGVRTVRVKCSMRGCVVTLAGKGDGLTLDDVIETLSDLLKEAKKANDQGLDSKTFQAVLRDKAKV